MDVSNDYKLLFQFIDTYLPVGFEGINKEDPLMVEVSQMMKKNNQYFYVADMLKLQILYVDPSVENLLGIDTNQFDPGYQIRTTHPDDRLRHSNSRGRMFKLCTDCYINGENECAVMSTNMRYQHADGHYINFLVQGYVFTATKPVSTTYCLFVNTDISWFGPIKHGFNHYLGTDKSYFRIPDRELILTGCIFTDREFEIVNLIREGLDSNQIGNKLFISPHTVDTHRRNILKKTGKATVYELIIDLQESSFF